MARDWADYRALEHYYIAHGECRRQIDVVHMEPRGWKIILCLSRASLNESPPPPWFSAVWNLLSKTRALNVFENETDVKRIT